jgi:hypothetical protein
MSKGSRTYNVLYTTTGHELVFRFPTAEAASRWNALVFAIKRHISDIAEKVNAEAREATYDDYRPWIIRCKVFIWTFGYAAVPGDIRHSINSVEMGFGMEETSWPVQ